MASIDDLNDGLNDAKGNINDLNEELGFTGDAVTSIGAKLVDSLRQAINEAEGLDRVGKKIARTYTNEISRAISGITTSIDTQVQLQDKLNKGEDITKELLKEQEKTQLKKSIILERIRRLKGEGLDVDQETQSELDRINKVQKDILDNLEAQNKVNVEANKERIRAVGITGNLAKGLENILRKTGFQDLAQSLNIKEAIDGAIKLDKNKKPFFDIATAAGNLASNLTKAIKPSDLIAFTLNQVKNILFELDNQLTKIQQNFGFSGRATNQIRRDLGEIANRSGDSFIQSKKLVESFTELSNTLGFIVDSSGETLVTYTNLTKRFGLANKEAAQLTGLLRLQGKFTEESLYNLIGSTNEFKNQINPALNVKDILKDISGASAAIVVSLGNNPELLAQAAASARGLGLELGQVEKIADSLVNFESSIRAELEAELLTGKQLNLERARFAALTNDLTGLTEELAKNQEVINSFATGNRIQQAAIAKSLGMSRDELAEMVLQQDFLNNLSSNQANLIKSQNKEQFEALSTQQRFNEAVSKLQDLLVNVVDVLSPLIDGLNMALSSMVGISAAGGAMLIAFKRAASSVLGLGKAMGNMFGKAALKKLPVIGTIISLGLALSEFAKGNFAAGVTQLVSGAASLVPGAGTAVAIGADIAYAGIKSGAMGIGDANLPSSSGPYTITSKSGQRFNTDPSDNIQVSPNPGGLSPDMSVIERKLDQLIAVVREDKIFALDGKQFAVATAVSRS